MAKRKQRISKHATIEGLGDAGAWLEQLAVDVQEKTSKKVLNKVAKKAKGVMLNQMAGLGILSSEATGTANKRSKKSRDLHLLQDSITNIKTKVFYSDSQDQWILLCGPSGFWATMVEYGSYTPMWGGAIKYLPPRPFVSQSQSDIDPIAVKMIVSALQEQIKKTEVRK